MAKKDFFKKKNNNKNSASLNGSVLYSFLLKPRSQGEWKERERISFPSAKAIIYSVETTLKRRNYARDKQGALLSTVFTFTPSLGVCLVVRLKPSILPANSPTTAGLKQRILYF